VPMPDSTPSDKPAANSTRPACGNRELAALPGGRR
jgi:hypothetical protein